ncbi:TPA: hypothetical protein HA316_02620 [Candidatus Micrarchaeota archaeon]|nr:hypothetical protein [Candidatus Micrarchaeota archaeon]
MTILDDILKSGAYTRRVKRAGMLQKITFRIIEEDGIKYLFSGKFFEIPELIEAANETGLPFKTKNGKVFPNKKSAESYRCKTSI